MVKVFWEPGAFNNKGTQFYNSGQGTGNCYLSVKLEPIPTEVLCEWPTVFIFVSMLLLIKYDKKRKAMGFE